MDVRSITEPDMSTYPGINMTQVLGPFFWGMFFLRWDYYEPLNICIGTLVSMMQVSIFHSKIVAGADHHIQINGHHRPTSLSLLPKQRSACCPANCMLVQSLVGQSTNI